MNLAPSHDTDHDTILADLKAGKDSILSVSLPADLLTPVAAYLKLSNWVGENNPFMFLLESIEGGAARGRYSVIGLKPDVVWKCQNGQVKYNAEYQKDISAYVVSDEAPLTSLRRLIHDSQLELPAHLPPMIGGVFGYLGYDMVRQMEYLPHLPPDDLHVPEGILIRPSLFLVFDNVKDELIIALPLRSQAKGAEEIDRLYKAAQAHLHDVQTILFSVMPEQNIGEEKQTTLSASISSPTSTYTKEEFLDVVEKIKEYIVAGDAFQVVPSQRFTAEFGLPPFMLYRSLRRINPAPFMFFLQMEDFALVGSSPEILVRLQKGVMTVRPLAGTRPRGKTPQEDKALEEELLADPKERAEHLMLIDLGRNDVGRVCTLGSVHVPERFVIERFSHVMHISSTVQGSIRPECDAIDALIAAFPAGTLTGAPKIRAMEIIDEVERSRRATYAGCIGYFGADGSMDTCIGLRMALVKDGKMHVQAGCGIVADSNAILEYEETQHKARALFRAAEDAIWFAGHTFI